MLVVDPATGVSQTGGKNPDAHSVLVLRAAYHENGHYYKKKVVARVYAECRVDLDMLANFILKLSAYYGNCRVVPEVNNSGLAVIELLKLTGVDIYEREVFNYRESKFTKHLGWQTKDGAGRDGTRSIAIATLASDIRDEDIEIPCEHVLKECRTFLVGDNGRAEALPGKHDDDVLALAIGVTTLDGATTYRMAERVGFTPDPMMNAGGRRRVETSQYS
jgi:hypothetical protein